MRDGLPAQEQPLGELRVGETLGEQGQHVALTSGQQTTGARARDQPFAEATQQARGPVDLEGEARPARVSAARRAWATATPGSDAATASARAIRASGLLERQPRSREVADSRPQRVTCLGIRGRGPDQPLGQLGEPGQRVPDVPGGHLGDPGGRSDRSVRLAAREMELGQQGQPGKGRELAVVLRECLRERCRSPPLGVRDRLVPADPGRRAQAEGVLSARREQLLCLPETSLADPELGQPTS